MGAKKSLPRATAQKPTHPLMLDGQRWDRSKVMAIVCHRIATSSNSIATILAQGWEGNKLPDYTTIQQWLSEDENLSHQYAKSKAEQADWLAEEMLAIADDGTNDYTEANDESGAYLLRGEHVQRSRLRIETRKWLMGKLRPKKYGDVTKVEHSGTVGLSQVLGELDGLSSGLPST